MNKLGINTLSNIIAKLWGMVSIFIFVPLYIRFLGESAYGLVSFFSILQSTLNLLGLGLSNTLRREFAIGDANDANKERKYKLLRSVENIYFLIGLIIIAICSFGSGIISNKWLNIEALDPQMVTNVIVLMGISIALQIIDNMYSGCLFGLDHQVYANVLYVLWAASKSVGSVIIAWRFKDLTLFYAWHCANDLIYLVVLRISIQRLLKCGRKLKWAPKDFSNLKVIWKYTIGILLISFIAIINKQLDKIVISRYLTLTELGAYNVATTLGSLIAIFPSALYTTVFTKFTNDVSRNDDVAVEVTFIPLNKISNVVICTMGAFVAFFSLPLIRLWTGSSVYVNTLGMTAFFVVMAMAVAEFQEIPYALALAHGHTKTNIIVGVCFIPFLFFMTQYFIKHHGLLGAGVVYLALMVGQSLLYESLIYRRFLKTSPMKLILMDTILPLVVAVAFAFVCKILCEKITKNHIVLSVLGCLSGGLTLVIMMIIFAKNDINGLIQRRTQDDTTR